MSLTTFCSVSMKGQVEAMTDRNRGFRNFRTCLPGFLAALLFALLCLSAGLASPTFAEETGESCRLTICAMYEEDSGKAGAAVSKPVSGMRIRLWRTADLIENAGSWSYKPVAAFASVQVSYEKMTASESIDASKKLMAAARSIPDAEGVTGSDGHLFFDNLKPGIYLAVQVKGNEKFRMDPCLWQIPMPESDSETGEVRWTYDVEVMPKTEEVSSENHVTPAPTPVNPPHKEPSKTPSASPVKTGDATPPLLPYAIACGAALVVLILIAGGRKKRNE